MTAIRSLDDLDGQPHANVFPDQEPRTIRLRLDEGETIPEHDHPEREIVFYVVEGRIELTLGDAIHQLTTGDIAQFDGDQNISPTAETESTALLVLASRSDA